MAKAAAKRDILLKKLGKHIAKLREEAGMNQTELAHRCNKDRQVISLLETGKSNPTVVTLAEIANELDVPVKDLLDFE